ncbi:TetR family transcriptional regulator [Xanthobacteraceae bacterium Astr-EGSB]|jgi:AcrR family transcriptional regulator|uniref:TetR/AcrR family transcriptional regulator n=1 Tax=Astrobacterium formosum TaxID=3069710 RepID=UPI0027ADF5E6|nr:TetR family transcriptional regulator [Xanthobacteraceae bacterium Astr-EGSB]
MTKPLRSQATRDRILNEARRLFAELGYERTTIRAIAAAAAINVSMVVRYFGSKEDLFAKAASLDLHVPDLASVPPDKRGEAIITRFLERWEGPEAGDELPALVRAAATHDAARQRVIELIMMQAGPEIRSTLADGQFERRLGLIITQISGLAFSRYVLKAPLVVALKREDIIQFLGATVQRYLSEEIKT